MAWTKLAGTSFRQDVIDAMEGIETLYLVAEPENEYDPNAVAVYEDGEDKQVGYVRKQEAEEISKKILNGERVEIIDYTITGGIEDKNYGINVFIKDYEDNLNQNELKKLIPDIGTGYIYFDEKEHVYFDENMRPMISGSRFESSQIPEFNPEFPAKALEKSTGVDADKIQRFWKKNGDFSSQLGTLIHEANEFWIKNHKDLETIDTSRDKEHTAKNWMPEILGEIVDEYWSEVDIKNTKAELLIRYKGFCGYVDQLQFLDDKTAIMRDYKIIKEHKRVKTQDYGNLDKYTLQQNFYRTILAKNGIELKGMYLDIYSNNQWQHKKLGRVEINEIE